MLEEVLEYLLRLPAHPMTVQMARKVQAHLQDPSARVARELTAQLAAAQQADRVVRGGVSSFTPSGIPVLQVAVYPESVRLSSPAAKEFGSTSKGRSFGLELVKDLAAGIEVELRPR